MLECGENQKLLEVANLNRPPPVKWICSEKNKNINTHIEFNYILLILLVTNIEVKLKTGESGFGVRSGLTSCEYVEGITILSKLSNKVQVRNSSFMENYIIIPLFYEYFKGDLVSMIYSYQEQ